MNEEDTSLDFFLKQWLSVAIEDTVRTIVQDTIRDTVTDIVRKEINNFLELFNDNSSGPLKEVHRNIDNLRDKHIQELKNTLYRLQENFGDLQSNVDGLRGELSEIKKPNGILEDIKNSLFKKNSDEIQRLNDDIARLNRKIDNLEKSLQDEKAKVIDANQNYSNAVTRLNVKDGELSRTQRELTDVKGKIAAKEKDLAAKEAELNNTKNELSRTKNELTGTKNDLSAERESVRNLNEKLSNTQNDLNKVRDDLNKANIKISTLQEQILVEKKNKEKAEEKVEKWTSSANIYEPVRTAITKCAIFRPIVEKYDLDDMSDTGLLVYAQAIGKTDSFAFEIYNTALENKKQTKEFMTYDEAEVYDALNKVYGYDVFALPGGQNITENFNRTKFDSTTSVYLHNPRDKNLPNTTGIYVPILMNRDGKVSQKAYVDAANR